MTPWGGNRGDPKPKGDVLYIFLPVLPSRAFLLPSLSLEAIQETLSWQETSCSTPAHWPSLADLDSPLPFSHPFKACQPRTPAQPRCWGVSSVSCQHTALWSVPPPWHWGPSPWWAWLGSHGLLGQGLGGRAYGRKDNSKPRRASWSCITPAPGLSLGAQGGDVYLRLLQTLLSFAWFGPFPVSRSLGKNSVWSWGDWRAQEEKGADVILLLNLPQQDLGEKKKGVMEKRRRWEITQHCNEGFFEMSHTLSPNSDLFQKWAPRSMGLFFETAVGDNARFPRWYIFFRWSFFLFFASFDEAQETWFERHK